MQCKLGVGSIRREQLNIQLAGLEPTILEAISDTFTTVLCACYVFLPPNAMSVPIASSTSSDCVAAAAAATLSTLLTLDNLLGLPESSPPAPSSPEPPPTTLLTKEKILMALATREEIQVKSELSCLEKIK